MQIVILNVKMEALPNLKPAPVNVQEAIQENIAKVNLTFNMSVCVYVYVSLPFYLCT